MAWLRVVRGGAGGVAHANGRGITSRCVMPWQGAQRIALFYPVHHHSSSINAKRQVVCRDNNSKLSDYAFCIRARWGARGKFSIKGICA